VGGEGWILSLEEGRYFKLPQWNLLKFCAIWIYQILC